MIDGIDLNEILAASPDQSRLTVPIPGRLGTHDPDLHKGAIPNLDQGILVVVRQVKVPRKPTLYLRIPPDRSNEQIPSVAVGAMIQPRTAIGDVHALEDPQAASRDGGMRKDEDLPPIGGGVRIDHADEPIQLLLIDVYLVTGIGCVTEPDRGQPQQQGPIPQIPRELWRVLVETVHPRLEVRFVRGKLVQSLQIVVARDDLVGDAAKIWMGKVFLGINEALGSAGIALFVSNILPSQVAQRNQTVGGWIPKRRRRGRGGVPFSRQEDFQLFQSQVLHCGAFPGLKAVIGQGKGGGEEAEAADDGADDAKSGKSIMACAQSRRACS
jgi:hypothetical protein